MGGADDADFLRIREILKERIRNEKKKALDAEDCSVDKKKIPKHRSFFGPSRHCIAPRLIDGKDALMQELKISSEDMRKADISDIVADSESSESENESGLPNVAKLRESRDYSFLSVEEEEVPKHDNEQTPDSIQGASMKLKSDRLKKGLVFSNTPKKAKSMTDKLKSTLESKPSLEKSQSETNGRLRKTAGKVDDEVSDEDEDSVNVSSIIQGLFRSNRKRPSTLDHNDRDDRVMVSSFADIEREERRSAKLGRQEDEIEALRIEQEEKKERLRRAKKQKMLHKSTTE